MVQSLVYAACPLREFRCSFYFLGSTDVLFLIENKKRFTLSHFGGTQFCSTLFNENSCRSWHGACDDLVLLSLSSYNKRQTFTPHRFGYPCNSVTLVYIQSSSQPSCP